MAELIWVSFRIRESERRKTVYAAAEDLANKYIRTSGKLEFAAPAFWEAPTSFIVFESTKPILATISKLAAGLDPKEDLLVVGDIADGQIYTFGKNPDENTLRKILGKKLTRLSRKSHVLGGT